MPKRGNFWERVDKSDINGCWIWKTRKNPGGYGTIGVKLAHRVAWELTNGKIPQGMDVCHHCDNPPCVNPAHLFIGTASDNLLDCVAKGRLDHRGTKNSNAKLSESHVLLIRKLNHPLSELAEMFHVSKSTIEFIKQGITWGVI
jgi:hypothetical protein